MKYSRIELAIENGTRFLLVTPTDSNQDKYPQYFIEYFANGKQTKHKEGVKRIYTDCIIGESAAKNAKIEKLRVAFKDKLTLLVGQIDSEKPKSTIERLTLNTHVLAAFKAFFNYHQLRHQMGEIKDIYNYTERNKKVTGFVESHCPKATLNDLNANLWVGYRSYLSGLGLGNSTINLQMVYVKGFYIWLYEINELPIHNHAMKLKRLDISRQEPKYHQINNDTFIDFFETVSKDDRYLRLHLVTRLVAENTLRPIQVRNIQVQDLDLGKNAIGVYDSKGKKKRTIIISEKSKQLIEKILNNTAQAGKAINGADYIIGQFNQTKSGRPYSQSMFRERIEIPFKEEFPQFRNVLVYDFKHTSISKAVTVNSLYDVQKRAGHAKVTTTQIYDRSDSVSSAITVEQLSQIS
ncbi:tyrosine-type recombinase/integrase [Pedobacter sp. GSP4]|uniref:tyrosine-type recombinase/integrase n=1 Tax=Pedobacter sp. GSP4 TaxID=3453716 RepID=UPI003EEA1649